MGWNTCNNNIFYKAFAFVRRAQLRKTNSLCWRLWWWVWCSALSWEKDKRCWFYIGHWQIEPCSFPIVIWNKAFWQMRPVLSKVFYFISLSGKTWPHRIKCMRYLSTSRAPQHDLQSSCLISRILTFLGMVTIQEWDGLGTAIGMVILQRMVSDT